MNNNHPLWQLEKAGYLKQAIDFDYDEKAVTGVFRFDVFSQLSNDPRFAEGELHHLHPDVGENLRDFRSYNGSLGRGSLQIVLDEKTGRFYADIDAWNPYQDLVNFLGHTGEVIGGFFRKLRRRKK